MPLHGPIVPTPRDIPRLQEWPMSGEPEYVRLVQYAELLLSMGRTKEAAEWAWKARAMIYAKIAKAEATSANRRCRSKE